MQNGKKDGKPVDSPGKIFIGGLSWETTTEKLTDHFKKYGEITDSIVMKDKDTGHPRGFGFVTYSDPSVLDKVTKESHLIDGRTVDVKRTLPRDRMVKGPKTKKIFVGGLPLTLKGDELKNYFSQFGKVVEHQIMNDRTTGRSRGFGFVTFENEQAVEEVLVQGNYQEIAGKQVEIKKAEPKKGSDDFVPVSHGPPMGRGAPGFNPGFNAAGPYGGGYSEGYSGFDSGAYRGGGSFGPRNDYGVGSYGGSGYAAGGGQYGGGGDMGYSRGSPLGGYASGFGSYGGTGGGSFGGYGDVGRPGPGYGGIGGSNAAGYGGGYSPPGGYNSALSNAGAGGRPSGASRNGKYHPYARS